jgi:hypothetical protein
MRTKVIEGVNVLDHPAFLDGAIEDKYDFTGHLVTTEHTSPDTGSKYPEWWYVFGDRVFNVSAPYRREGEVPVRGIRWEESDAEGFLRLVKLTTILRRLSINGLMTMSLSMLTKPSRVRKRMQSESKFGAQRLTATSIVIFLLEKTKEKTMGMYINVYRDAGGYDCSKNGVSRNFNSVCVTNIEGPFEPTEERPAVLLLEGPGPGGNPILVPIEVIESGAHYMFGGNFGYTSDSRFSEAVKKIAPGNTGAVKFHDRVERCD